MAARAGCGDGLSCLFTSNASTSMQGAAGWAIGYPRIYCFDHVFQVLFHYHPATVTSSSLVPHRHAGFETAVTAGAAAASEGTSYAPCSWLSPSSFLLAPGFLGCSPGPPPPPRLQELATTDPRKTAAAPGRRGRRGGAARPLVWKERRHGQATHVGGHVQLTRCRRSR